MSDPTFVIDLAAGGMVAAEIARRAILGRRMERAIGRWGPDHAAVVPVRSASLPGVSGPSEQ